MGGDTDGLSIYMFYSLVALHHHPTASEDVSSAISQTARHLAGRMQGRDTTACPLWQHPRPEPYLAAVRPCCRISARQTHIWDDDRTVSSALITIRDGRE